MIARDRFNTLLLEMGLILDRIFVDVKEYGEEGMLLLRLREREKEEKGVWAFGSFGPSFLHVFFFSCFWVVNKYYYYVFIWLILLSL